MDFKVIHVLLVHNEIPEVQLFLRNMKQIEVDNLKKFIHKNIHITLSTLLNNKLYIHKRYL